MLCSASMIYIESCHPKDQVIWAVCCHMLQETMPQNLVHLHHGANNKNQVGNLPPGIKSP